MTVSGNTDLVLTTFTWGPIHVLLVSFSLSSSTGANTKEEMTALGTARLLLGSYGVGGGW